jgi:hypothetical protein
MTLELRENGQVLGSFSPAVSLQALAYRDLKEKIPGIVVRNVTRLATHIGAQAIANQGGDALKYSVLAFNALSALLTKADTRAWYTLPMAAQLYRGPLAPGLHNLELRNAANGSIIIIPLTVADGERRLIWVADLGGNARVATVSLNGKGAPPTFAVCGGVLPQPAPASSAPFQPVWTP